MSICINNNLIEVGSLSLKELVKYDMNYSKLWKDADRNMAGDVSATLIGIFPNIEVETTPLTQAQVQTLCSELDKAYFTLRFWDPATGTQKQAQYYSSDYKVSLLSRITGMYGTVEFTVVPVSRRQ